MKAKHIFFFLTSAVLISSLFLASCKDKDETPTPLPVALPAYLNANITYGSVTDGEGNKYATVTIGTQTWMAENLRSTKYRNGDAIPNVTDSASWGLLSTGAQCTYKNTTIQDSITKNGRFYNWYAVNDARHIAPAGWHVATNDEWTTLSTYVNTHYGTSLNTAKALAASKGWGTTSAKGAVGNNMSINNSTGFSALPSGLRGSNGAFGYVSTGGYWWTSLEDDANNAWGNFLGISTNSVSGEFNSKLSGLSVRCVKD